MRSALDIYTDFFGLRERPFSLVPDPGFLFWSEPHRAAYAMLEYGILARSPITLVTGEVGAGKTTLVHHLIRSLGDDAEVGLVANAHGDRGDLLRWVLMAFGQPAAPGAGPVDLFGQFQSFLVHRHAEGRRVILIFDEAQNLGRESLEELRMFTNINANKDEIFQIVLVGQPELRETITQPGLVQFAQRVAASVHLPALDARAIHDYVAHRMAVAGARTRVFRPAAIEAIHAVTDGIPRLVNQLCDFALVYAFSRDETEVLADTVQQVLDDGVFFGAGRTAARVRVLRPRQLRVME